MPTLQEFYSQVSSELRRGTSFDSVIPEKVRQALRWLEDLHTFKHMEIYNPTQMITSGINYVNVPTGFKSMEFWRIEKGSTAGFRYLNKVNARDVDRIDTTMPKGYIESGDSKFYFDAIPDKDYTSNMFYIAYTTLPADTNESPAVVQKFEGLLLSQTCVLFAPRLRDDKFLVTHKANRDDLTKSAIWADVERRQANEDNSSIYGAEFREQINDGE